MYIKVRVTAGSKKEKIIKKDNNTYIISIKEPAERNLANSRIIEIMSQIFEISIQNIRIISGHRSPSKILSINF